MNHISIYEQSDNMFYQVQRWLNNIAEGILDILFPKFCAGCSKEGQYICNNCEVFLSEVPIDKENLFSVWEYEGLIKKLIQKVKLNGQYHILDELIEKAFDKIILDFPSATCITYVPMHKNKEKKRGFNQSCLLAQKLGSLLAQSKQCSIKVLPLLMKIKDNRSQDELDPKEREENVESAFKFQGSFIPKNVLLVDDFYITGATIRECVKTLNKAGVKNVWVFTLARKLNL
jgi:ComF family protein